MRLAFLFCFLIPFYSVAQTTIEGKITDNETGESLPFVHILSNQVKGISDIEGIYRLKIPASLSRQDSILFSLVGYEKRRISVGTLIDEPNVRLKAASFGLKEVTIVAKEDPAYAMIRRAVDRRKENDPERMERFRYRSYNKAYLDFERTPEVNRDLDSTGFANAHFMIIESATEVTYQRPGKVKERLLANQVSGFSNPLFSLQSNSFQPFTSYSTYLDLLGFDFLNPISPNSRGSYVFQLEDSTATAEGKAYIISFRPRKNASGNLLQGSLSLDADDWAIVTIQARNAGEYNLADFEIRQSYSKTRGHWFPEQSSSRYNFKESDPAFYAVSNTYIDSVVYDFEPGNFGIADIEIREEANRLSPSEWENFRQVDLTTQESNTYKVYDTLDTKVLNIFDWAMGQTIPLSKGRISWGKVDFMLNHLFDFNQYEGVRLGLGLALNDKFIPWVSPEAYFAYGFRDREIKYGGGLRFNIIPEREMELYLGYRSDVDEPGRIRRRDQVGFMRIGEIERNLFIRFMNPVETWLGELSIRPARNLKTTVRFSRELRSFERNLDLDAGFEPYDLTTSEFGLRFELNPGESLMFTNNRLLRQGTSYPRMTLDVSYAVPDLLDSEQEFLRVEFEFVHEVAVRKLGALRLHSKLGAVEAEQINSANLMLSRGIRGEEDFGLVAFGYFHTLPVYGFINDRYAQAGFSQNLGNPFGIEFSFSRPELVLMYQAAIGDLSTPADLIPGIPASGMNRPYLEGGLILDNLLRLKGTVSYSGFGLGVFLRHGYYATTDIEDNLAFALNFAVSF